MDTVIFKNMVGVDIWRKGTAIEERLILCSVDTFVCTELLAGLDIDFIYRFYI